MKKVFAFFVVLFATVSTMALEQSPMSFTMNSTTKGDSYSEKEYTGDFTVSIDKDYTATGTYKICSYLDGETQKLDVTIPAYELIGTTVGDLAIGTYTVSGLTYSEEKGGYYRDYKDDGLTMHFTAPLMGIDKDYEFSFGQVLVVMDGNNITITNGFKPGAMPFLITSKYTHKGIYGDVNGDDKVDISDVNATIAVICGGEKNDLADVNADGKVDVSDVNVLIEIICSGK